MKEPYSVNHGFTSETWQTRTRFLGFHAATFDAMYTPLAQVSVRNRCSVSNASSFCGA
jgi:hypothetical protein